MSQLFGYAHTCEDAPSPYFRNLAINFPNSSIKDVLLMAIDIDTIQGHDRVTTDQQFHISISLLDSRVSNPQAPCCKLIVSRTR